LSIVAGNILRVVGGAGELSRYHVGDVLKFAGFATATNNLPGWVVSSVAVNGADLDITLKVLGKTSPTVEGVGAGRSISLVTRSVFCYAAAANTIGLSGYTDWRLPGGVELAELRQIEAPTAFPDIAAFPTWVASLLSFSTRPDNTGQEYFVNFTNGQLTGSAKTAAGSCVLVRNV
jgi:hypothetical protein